MIGKGKQKKILRLLYVRKFAGIRNVLMIPIALKMIQKIMNKEFISWLRENCSTDVFKKDGIYYTLWIINSEIDDWDGFSKKGYTDEEIYNRWLTTQK
jgi:hypothetical protein